METSGNQNAANLVAEIELIYRPNVKASEMPKVISANEAAKLFMENWDADKLEFVEQFKVMFLNRGNSVLGISTISTGGTTATLVDAKLVFAAALKVNASCIILAHNHPSGNPKPSNADIKLTKKLKKAGEILNIPVMDHIIVTAEGFFSFQNEGVL